MLSGNELFGESTLWKVFINMSIAELILFSGFFLIFIAFAWLIKGVRKGLKEEKKRYGNKHHKRNR